VRYLLRLEGVNFDSFVLDTSDLSTIRGGGLLLLDAPEDIERAGILGLTREFSGASQALFTFHAENDIAAEAICATVEDKVHQGARSGATVLVVHEPFPEHADFQATNRKLVNRTRWLQLQSPSVIYPEPSGTEVDKLDDTRPAVDTGRANPSGGNWILSPTTLARREYGLTHKRAIYGRVKWEESPWAGEFSFHSADEYTNEFRQIAENSQQGNLNGKMAVIYLDGNRFGRISASCETLGEYSEWSLRVQANQNSFLHYLLCLRCAPGREQTSWHWSGEQETNTGNTVKKIRAFRIETLLWGGDEIIWVVPAWCGWWMLGEFYRVYGKLKWKCQKDVAPEYNAGDAKYRLTHGAGIVFCHETAPVRRIVHLARELANRPKDLGTRGRSERDYEDLFAYQVLESFDHLGTDIDGVRRKRMPVPLQSGENCTDTLVLGGWGMISAIQSLEEFRTRFPRSKLHRILHLYGPQGNKADGPSALEVGTNELARAGLKEEFQTLKKYFGERAGADNAAKTAATWMHIHELWDYTTMPDWEMPAATVEEPV